MKKILVVDDDPNITFTFDTILKKQGYEVQTYNNPRKAALEFEGGKYNLALIDIRMPKMNGFELYREIRKNDPHVKVCFITAFEISKEESGSPSSDGLVVFLKKPIGMKELTDTVLNLVSA
jgi:two-component system, OmpR family, response regulator ChvI